MEKDKVYQLKLDMWSTAIVFNKGHRLALRISSSNAPKYEVHPNTYPPVHSMKEAKKAKNTIMLSENYPSRIVLPVVKPVQE